MLNDPFFSGKEWLTRLTPFSMVRPYFLELLSISLMINLLSLALPLTLLQIYDRILRFSAISTLQLLLIGVFVALFLESLLRLGRSYLSGWIGARFEHLAACGAMEHLLQSPLTTFEHDKAGVHLERLNAIQTLKEFYSGQAALVVLEMPFVLVFLLLIYHLAGTLVLVPVVLFVLFLLFAWYYRSSLYKKIAASGASDDKRMDFMIEVLQGMHTVKSLSLEAMMARRYERLLAESAQHTEAIGIQGAYSQNTGLFFSQLATISVVTFGGMLVMNQQLTVGGLVACSMLAGRALQPMQAAVGIWARFQSIRIARERLLTLFSQTPPSQQEPLPGPPKVTSGAISGSETPSGPSRLELNNITFLQHYSPDNRPIINGLNLKVAPGEAVGIIGTNGSGKTLLLEMILGLLPPSTGEVLVDGCNPVTTSLSQVAYLPQEGVLFRGTIMENLHMFREENRDAALIMAKRLGLDLFFATLPKGYETEIEEGNTEVIPRGIQQRIAIARALLITPQLVLFDEANTAIDGAGDGQLMEVLQRLRGISTLILVSHRPSLLKLADRVLELRGGILVPLSSFHAPLPHSKRPDHNKKSAHNNPLVHDNRQDSNNSSAHNHRSHMPSDSRPRGG